MFYVFHSQPLHGIVSEDSLSPINWAEVYFFFSTSQPQTPLRKIYNFVRIPIIIQTQCQFSISICYELVKVYVTAKVPVLLTLSVEKESCVIKNTHELVVVVILIPTSA